MPEALWTILGVTLGACISGAFVIAAANLAKRSADSDREEAQAARLFHARRVAYEDFQSAARVVVEAVWKGWGDGPRPDFDVLDEVVRILGIVRLYASPTTVAAAEDLLRVLDQFVASDPVDAPSVEAINGAYEWAEDALKAFAVTARADLA